MFHSFSYITFDLIFQPAVSFVENITASDMDNKALMTVYDRHLYLFVERVVIFCGLMPVLVIFGVFGNIMTLVVLFKENDGSTTSIYIKNLAVADLLTLITRGVYMVCIWWQVFWPEKYLSWKLNSASISILSVFFSEKISKCITVVIVLDRIVAVKWPFKYKNICTPRRAVISMLVIYSVVIITSFPLIIDVFIYFNANTANLATQKYPTTGSERHQYVTSRLVNSVTLRLSQLVSRVTEFAIILVTVVGNVVIIRCMRKGTVINPTLNITSEQRQHQQRQITKLCLTISFTFLFLCGPLDIFVLIVLAGRMQKINYSTFSINIFSFLTTVNSAINFVIYAVTNKKYRQAYSAILLCIKSTVQENTPDMLERRDNVQEIEVGTVEMTV